MVGRSGVLLAAAVLAMSSVSAVAATFDVTRFDDPSSPGHSSDGLSLRQAVLLANATPGADTITLHAGTYRLKLRGDDADAVAGDLDITTVITIEGDAAGRTVIDATKAKDRAFEVLAGGDLTIHNVTVKGGSAVVDGGGILSVGTLTVSNCVFTGNKAGNSGGGIASEAGTCTLTDVIVTKNKSLTNDGGGVEFQVAGTATLTRVTIAGNTAADTGGGVDTNNGVTVSMQDCTVSGNKSKHEGGGLDPSAGTLTLTNVTISGNKSLVGGGIQLEAGGFVVLDHCTIAHNKAHQGGGLWTELGTTATLTATIVATNLPEDCFGPIVSGGSNLIGHNHGFAISGDQAGNLYGAGSPPVPLNPRLGPLANNGGPTKTHALLPGSPAINAVVGVCPLALDQRGFMRVGKCDMGAFEVQ